MSNFLTSALFEADGTTLVRRLETAYDRQWLDERDGEGSFSFNIPYEDATELTTGRIVKFSWGTTNTAYVFAGVIESVTVSKTGGNVQGENRVAAVSGRGVRCLLENALVYPAGGSTTRTFNSVSAGKIMRTLLTEAHARGALLELSADFTDTVDSNGAAFSKSLTLSESAGTTLSEIAARHQELAVDIYVSPDMEIRYYNNRGADRTVGSPTVSLRVGQSVGELSTEKAGPVRNTVLVAYGSNAFVTRSNSGSVGTYGRKETYLNLSSNTASATHANLAGDQVLSVSAVPSDGITVQIDTSGPQPYEEFDIGDYLWVVDHTATRSKYRVSSITATEGDDGSVTFVPELGTLRADLTRRLNRALSRLEAKNAGGASTVDLTPGTGTGGGIVVLPGGVILPATIDAGTYPIARDLLTDIATLPYQVLNQSLPWSVVDLTAIGYYSRTLVTGSFKPDGSYTGTAFINLDNAAYSSFAPSSVPLSVHTNSFRLLNGSLYHFGSSISKFTGTAWVSILSNIITKPFQVGTIWYALTNLGLYSFDETTEIATLVTGLPSTGSGTILWASIGNGYVWFCFAVSGSSIRRLYVRPVTVAGAWTNPYADLGNVAGGAVGVALDGDLLAYAAPASASVGTGVFYRLAQDGTTTTTSGVAGYLDDIRAAGHTIVQNAYQVYQNAANPQTGASNYKEAGAFLAGMTSEWILVGTTYGTGGRSDCKFRIDAVGPQGYVTVVPETATLIPVPSGGAIDRNIGAENFTWAPNGAEDTLRISANERAYEYNVTLELP